MKLIYSWQDAVLKSSLQAPTKLVLLTLATFMNERGDNCWPSLERLSKDTSLARRTVINHIDAAILAGFLSKTKRQNNGSHDSNQYWPTLPDGVVHFLHHRDSGGASDDNSVVHGMHPNNPVEQPIKKEPKGSTKKDDGEFEMFWANFPKQRAGSKEKAKAAYWNAVSRGGSTAILAGVIAYAKSDEVARGYAKGAAAWLNDDRWTNHYGAAPGKTQTSAMGVPILSERDSQVML